MKRRICRAFALMLVCAMLLTSLISCASSGKTMLELDGVKMSENVYMLLLSRLKGQLASASYYSTEALRDSFWDAVMLSDGTTREEYYKDKLLDDAKFYLAALKVFDELDLELPDSYIEEIDTELEELIENDAEGSKTTFNAILSDFGANYKILREAYIMEAKLEYLKDYLYGSNGSKISEIVYEEYYQKNYARFKHVFISTYAPIYETDSDGCDIYFTDDGKIAYDTTKLKRRDSKGNEVRDEDGLVVYETEDGKIAYDKENGNREVVRDSNGNVLTRKFTQDELIKLEDHSTLILEKAVENNFTLFDQLVTDYSEDNEYSNGIYLTKSSNYDAPEVIENLFGTDEIEPMKVGEIRKIYSDYGIHIVMRYETEVGGYADEQNADFFVSNKTGTYNFLETLKTQLLGGYLAPYIEKVVIDEELYAAISPKSLGANFYY